MTTFSRAAVAALALGLAGGLVAAPAALAAKKEAAPTGPKLSKPVAVALSAAQTASAAKDFVTAKAKLAEAELAPKRTDEDNHWINMIKINVAQGAQDMVMLAQALEGAAASAMTAPADKARFTKVLRSLAYQANDLPGAIKWGEQLVALNPADGQAAVELAQIYNQAKQPAKGFAMLKQAIDTQKASGQPVPEAWYKSAAAEAVNNPAMGKEFGSTALAWVTAYPTPENWRTVLELFQERAKFDDQGNLDLFRLKFSASALKGERDYVEYAETANLRGLPGEAKQVLDAGLAATAIDLKKPYIRDLKAIVEPKVARDKASLTALEKEARTTGNPKLIVGLADAHLGYGNAVKAVELYTLALGKAGVDAAAVNTRIGIAKARSGDAAGAKAALELVTGGNRQLLAQFWLVWITSKAS